MAPEQSHDLVEVFLPQAWRNGATRGPLLRHNSRSIVFAVAILGRALRQACYAATLEMKLSISLASGPGSWRRAPPRSPRTCVSGRTPTLGAVTAGLVGVHARTASRGLT